ncbi:hypothetical protein [Trueperella bernardiae]|uniref:hypothetical protein n=1 Tax=Trueperella bernardiae TaxID=59561 RepID=UPI0020442EA4|nr:hypothetical protein [Trueperella bernardiae]MCM3907401.1 hypothetical protein [Trueperella bernardiae]
MRECWAALPDGDREWALAFALDLAKEFIAGAGVTVAMWGGYAENELAGPVREFERFFAEHRDRTVLAAKNGDLTPKHINVRPGLPVGCCAARAVPL